MAPQTEALAVPGKAAYAIMGVDPQELASIMSENTGGEKFSPFELDRVKVPAGGGTTWTVPSITGEVEAKTLEGIIIAQRNVRSYWPDAFSGTGTPPSCSSQDGVLGIGDPGGACDICPLAEFGSGPNGRSQACKTAKLLFLLRPESVLPMLVSIPPSSLKVMRSFMLQMTGQEMPFYGAIVGLGLSRDKNADGVMFSKVAPSIVRRLSPDELATMRSVHASLSPILSGVRAEADLE